MIQDDILPPHQPYLHYNRHNPTATSMNTRNCQQSLSLGYFSFKGVEHCPSFIWTCKCPKFVNDLLFLLGVLDHYPDFKVQSLLISLAPKSPPTCQPSPASPSPPPLPSHFQVAKNAQQNSISSPLISIKFPLNFKPPQTPKLSIKAKSSSSSNPSIVNDASASSAPDSLKSRLKNGETLYGIFLLSFSPTIAEIAGLAGYDFAVVDMEHGPGGITDALHCLRALSATRTPAILRLPESSPTWAKKALDLGPQGIMFPMIESPKMARKAVSYCRFPPDGIRGSAHTVVRASDYGIDEGYLSNYAEELLIMCQVESEEGAKKAEEISAVDGVDCVQMGPLDLSASMGEFLKGGASLGGFAMPHDGPIDLKTRGYHMVSGTVDVGLFRSAAVDDVRKFKMSLIQRSDDEAEDGKDGDEKYWSE
ncbi:2-KETO-3-DEOXY-L-RHAMNONATE ALDOLASE [Salix viminalis]|uniref:2-KETO-3-DEOXY-L-RHAMNONATE ALDOLASE n=1 Tax=Salix viminalis TaxID=40686 RepID=A0A9Q0QB50_SALVM|nr:2-KETO-3-DEOXY-L-RHAMNONATE ALDOLASE [Salix viminalis]